MNIKVEIQVEVKVIHLRYKTALNTGFSAQVKVHIQVLEINKISI